MYINQIVTYLVWPVFIIVSWLIIRSAVIIYERRFVAGVSKNDINSTAPSEQK